MSKRKRKVTVDKIRAINRKAMLLRAAPTIEIPTKRVVLGETDRDHEIWDVYLPDLGIYAKLYCKL